MNELKQRSRALQDKARMIADLNKPLISDRLIVAGSLLFWGSLLIGSLYFLVLANV